MVMHIARRIERFLRRHGMSATRFGREAMGDPRFVFDLRNGRELRDSTAARVAAWLDRRETGR
jgi:2,4-dienoyl-CoA reductase-like NADH-dependent reductase (Old Yellow Enzyme family)